MEIRLLGALEVTDRAGEPVEVRGAKERSLLALLALNAGRPVSRDAIVDALWPEGDPESAARSLRVRLSNLRRLLGSESIVRTEAGYALAISGDDVDALRFEDLLGQGRAEDALALWRGEPLAGLSGDWVSREQRRFDELRLRAREEHLAAAIDAGEGAGRVAELQHLVDEDPLRERPRELLMRALYQAGRQAEALELYHQTRKLLDEELGLEPSPQLRDLERAILTHDAQLANPPPAVARPKKRSWRIATLAAVAALLAAALVFWPRAGGAALRLQPNSIGELDPSNGRLTAVEPVGRQPIAIATGLGYVWVANAGDSTVTRLDPRTLETRTIGLPAPPTGIAVGYGAAWVAVAGPELIEITPAGGTTDIPLPLRVAAVTVTGDGILAALSRGPWRESPLLVIDAATHRVVRTGNLDNPAVAAATVTRRAWLVSNDWSGDGRLVAYVLLRRAKQPIYIAAIPSSNATPAPICVSGALGELWIPAQGANAVWHISSVGEIGSITLPARPTCVTAMSNRIWFSSADGDVLQLDPSTSTTHTMLRTSASPSAIAAGFGRIWVAAS